MNRFTDRVERDLSQIADRATPSSTAWEAIRTRIDEQPDHESTMEVIMLSPNENPPTRSRFWLVAAASVAAIVGVGAIAYFAVSDDGDGAPVVEQPDDDTPVVEVDAPETDITLPAVTPDAEPTVLPAAGGPLSAGGYTTDWLGMDVGFESSRKGSVAVARPGEVLLITDAGSLTGVAIQRIGGWYNAEQAGDVTYIGQGSIDPNDIDAWTADLGLVSQELPDTTVDGRRTIVREITTGPMTQVNAGCPEFDEGCFYNASVSEPSFDPLTARDPNIIIPGDLTSRNWLILIDGQDPISFTVFSASDSLEWLDEFETETLPTITLGPDAPAMQR
jgi:hypothetical protein